MTKWYPVSMRWIAFCSQFFWLGCEPEDKGDSSVFPKGSSVFIFPPFLLSSTSPFTKFLLLYYNIVTPNWLFLIFLVMEEYKLNWFLATVCDALSLLCHNNTLPFALPFFTTICSWYTQNNNQQSDCLYTIVLTWERSKKKEGKWGKLPV